MSSEDSESGTAPAGAEPAGKAAELMAAVRAVERGEASATEFFTQPAPPPPVPAARTAPAAAAPGGAPAAPVPVPEELPALLAGAGAPEALAGPVAAALGERAAELLRADPWALLAAPGVLPEQADGFARALLGGECGPGDERRTAALCCWLLERAARHGHTSVAPEVLHRELASFAVPDPPAALEAAAESGAVLLFADPLPGAAPRDGHGAREGAPAPSDEEEPDGEAAVPVRASVALDRYAAAEENVADALLRLRTTFRREDGPGGDPAAWQQAADGAPSPSARELIGAVAGHGVVVHTGGAAAQAEPLALLAAAPALGLRAVVAARTADGCRRASAALAAVGGGPDGEDPEAAGAGPVVATVAALLAGAAGARDAEGQLEADLLVLLDAAQLDTETAGALCEALPDGARLVLSGDPQLLGAAGPGQVLADLLSAAVCPAVVSRTPDPGPLGELVSSVGVGELPRVDAPDKEVVVVPVRDAGEALHRTVQLVTESIPRAFGQPADAVVVITPAHGGPVGTRALNSALKERVNPGPGKFGGFDTGDRIAWTPVPGDTRLGTVSGADETGLRLECAGQPVVVPVAAVGSVRHAWALTAHQAAGHRWPAAVAVVPGDAGATLNRPWAATAFSRAEAHLSVVQGAGPQLAAAIAADPPVRQTRLATLLRQQAEQG